MYKSGHLQGTCPYNASCINKHKYRVCTCAHWAEARMQQYVHHQLTNFASQRLCKTWHSARASLPWATDSKLRKGFVFKGFHHSFILFLWTWKHNRTFMQNIKNQLRLFGAQWEHLTSVLNIYWPHLYFEQGFSSSVV